MKAVRKVSENNKLETKLDYKQVVVGSNYMCARMHTHVMVYHVTCTRDDVIVMLKPKKQLDRRTGLWRGVWLVTGVLKFYVTGARNVAPI